MTLSILPETMSKVESFCLKILEKSYSERKIASLVSNESLMYFAESSTALGISLHSLVQQTLRTVSVVSSLYCIHTFVYHSHSNHSVLMLQCSLVLLLPGVNALTTCVWPET